MTDNLTGRPSRRSALTMMSVSAVAAALGRPGTALAGVSSPVLATPAQIEAERTLLALLDDPELRALQAKLKAEFLATPKGQTVDGAARLDNAIAEWTNSLLFKEIADYRPTPAILWATDDTPRTWLGHTLGGVGTSGDNPDNIYRLAFLDGGGRYEIVGQVDPARRPAQFSLEIVRGDGAQPARPKPQTSKHTDMGNQVAMVTDRDVVIGPDGAFRIALGGSAAGPDHIALPPELLTLGFRDTLSDWSQRPNRLTLHRLDSDAPKPFDPAELHRRVLEKLGGYIRFWSAFPDTWFGGLQPNTSSGPVARDGGWGFVAGIRFSLAPEKAIVVTTTRADAHYTGFQLIDPWMIAPDTRRYQVSLNLSQATPDPDGRYTYVISASDPGVANWLDTAGLKEGFGILRWQGLSPTTAPADLLRDFRVVPLSQIARLSGPVRVSPRGRQLQLEARATGYANRLL